MLEGPNVIAAARQSMGATDPKQAAPGTIRGDFGIDLGLNLVHGSDSPESAEREIGLFFEGLPLLEWERDSERWSFENE